MNKKEKYTSQNLLVVMSGGATTFLVVVYLVLISSTNNLDTTDALEFLDVWSPVMIFLLLLSEILALFAAIKTKWPIKLLPLVCVVINAILIFVVLFFYGFKP